jgi:secreted Zn-dependent insulinase-like peptidase
VKLQDEFIAHLKTINPTENEKIGYPPINKFIPEKLEEKLAARPLDSNPSLPMIISENPVIWFKQDDTFNQPFAFVQIKIDTADCLFPLTPQSQIFASIWKSCLNESLREIGYLAQLAGQGSALSLSSDYLTVGFSGYNDGIQNYMQEVMRLI